MKTLFICIPFFFLVSCQQSQTPTCKVVVSFRGTSADSVFLRRISLNGGFTKKLDSGLLESAKDSLVFELPVSADSLYDLSLQFSRNKLLFITDCNQMRIVMDTKSGRNMVTGSPSTSALLNFNQTQDSLRRFIKVLWDVFNSKNISQKQKDSIQKRMQVFDKEIQDRFYHFGDTVSNSAAFMENYDYIDFKEDFGEMKTYMAKAVHRFPQSRAMARLNEQVLKAAHIHEKELEVGEAFPRLSLPDLNKQMHTTDSANGRYTLIFFWASWCPKCMFYDKIKYELDRDKQYKNLTFISVALDDHEDLCRQIAEANKQPGLQLIDRDIWQGQTADKIAFDSLPFNFLIGPDQRILAKAIPPDSLIFTLNKFIH